MRFSSFRKIAKFLNVSVGSIDEDSITLVTQKIEEEFSSDAQLKIEGYSFTKEEVLNILEQLSVAKNRVFHDWIDQNEELSLYLLSEGEKGENPILGELKEHQLFTEYQKFIDIYLKSISKQKISKALEEKSIYDIQHHLKFSAFLPESSRIEIHHSVSLFVRKQIQFVEENYQEKYNWEDTNQLFTVQFIEILNHLDRHFYSDSVQYLDMVSNKLSDSKLPLDQRTKIMAVLKLLNLTDEHKKQIHTFHQDQVKQIIKNQNPTRKKVIKSPIFIILSLVVILLLFSPKLFDLFDKKNIDSEISLILGSDSLTDQDLLHIDSLFRNNKSIHSSNLPDDYFVGIFNVVSEFNKIENQTIRNLYSSMLYDHEIQATRGFQSCPKTSSNLYQTPVYQSLEKVIQSFPNHTIKNKTGYDVFILIYEPISQGKSFGYLLKNEESLYIQLEDGYELIFYAGKQLNAFNLNDDYTTSDKRDFINKNFTHHFCQQDEQSFHFLRKIYTFFDLGKETSLKKESTTGEFDVESDAILEKL